MRTVSRRSSRVASYVVFACLWGGGSAHSQSVVYRRVALTGEAAPGTPNGVVFEQFGGVPNFGSDFAPTIDDVGTVVFHARLAGPGIIGHDFTDGNALGIWRTSGGVTTLLARQDEPAPGTAIDVEFMGFPTFLSTAPPLTAAGRATFAGGLRGPGVDGQYFSNAVGIWSEAFGGTQLVVRLGDQAPGLPAGFTFRAMALPFASVSGRIAFNSGWRAPGDPPDLHPPEQEGFWSDRSGTMELLARGGQQAPGTPAGVVFGEGGQFAIEGAFRSWGTNDALRIAFHGNLAGPGIGDLNDEGIWVEAPDGIALLAREGQPAPGAGAGVKFGAPNGIDAFGDIVPVRMGGTGAILFGARLSGGGIPFMRSIWTNRSGPLELFVRGTTPNPGSAAGDPAPGFGPGWTFSAMTLVHIDALDQIAFSGKATFNLDSQTQREGIWWERGGPLSLLAAEGEAAPGTAPGVVLDGLSLFLTQSDAGDLAFLSTLAGPGVTGGNFIALYLVEPDGTRHLALRTGQIFDVSGQGSDLRTVSGITPGPMNAAGDLPVEIRFTGGSTALFVTRLGALAPPLLFCFGDGTATACPCGNDGALEHGCSNSEAPGGRLATSGVARVGTDTLVLAGNSMPGTGWALYFQGTQDENGGAGTPFGDGLRCVAGTLIRLGLRANVGGVSSYPGPGDPPISVAGGVTAGATRSYQVWYRDPALFCTGATFNLTNGVRVTWAP